ncbi:MAG: viscotoxin-A3 [Coriobacteriia bacterium]|nr:viscotoxin-A3 [Coriobacteriia bacterium]
MTDLPPADGTLHLRTAGYCVLCDRIVERLANGTCAAGHPAEAISGRIVLTGEEPVPQLPRFNLAAFLLPPVWGPAHGLWAGAIFLPLLLFADSILRSTGRGAFAVGGALFVIVATLAMMAWFAKRANGLAWRRVSDRVSVAEYVRRERLWAAVAVPTAAVLLGAALYFDLVILPARTG